MKNAFISRILDFFKEVILLMSLLRQRIFKQASSAKEEEMLFI